MVHGQEVPRLERAHDASVLWLLDRSRAITVIHSSALPLAEQVVRRWRSARVDAHDLVDELVVRLLAEDGAQLSRADADAPWDAWLRRFLTNLAREARRVERRARVDLASVVARLAARREARAKSRRSRLAAYPPDVRSLTRRQRSALDLYLAGWTIRDISTALRCRVAAVGELLERAMRRLRGEPSGAGAGGERLRRPRASERALARLSRRDRDLYEMWSRLPRSKLAAALGVRPATVRMRIHRLRRRLSRLRSPSS